MVKVTMPLGLLAVIPTMALLTASFFVMVVLRKLEEGPLKSFGRIIAAFLCIAAFAVFTIGIMSCQPAIVLW